MRHLMLLPLIFAAAPAAQASDQEPRNTQVPQQQTGPSVELSSGVEYEEGDFGTDSEVQTITVPTTLRVTTGRLQISATLPYVRMEAPANVRSSGGLLGLPIIIDPTIPPDGRVRRDGVGDLSLGASYALPVAFADLAVSGEVKLPTASDGIGTGETDFAIGAEIAKDLGGISPFAGVSYTMPGDPQNYSLRNSFAFRGGLAAPIGGRARAYAFYSRAQSLSENVPDQERIVGGVNAGIGSGLTLGVYGAAGLSDGSPDVGAGLRLGIRIR